MTLARTPVVTLALIVGLALIAPLLGLPDPVRMDAAHRLAPPSWPHPLGLDELGRDELSRVIWGGRASLAVAFVASLIAGLIGTLIGIAGGFLRGFVEQALLRAVDVVLCFPPLLLALLVVTLLGPGARTLILVLSVLFIPGFARVAYASTLAVRSHGFVEAVQALGASRPRIMLRTILPNVLGPVLVQLSLAAASAIVLESGLSFLGLGVVPPTPSWGLAIGAARATMNQAPLLLLWPSLALTATILAMNALCDALRDAFEPQAAVPRTVARHLRDAVFGPKAAAPPADKLLDIRDLTIAIETPRGTVAPVRGVSLSVAAGETLAIVGESGSGKTLTGLSILGLLPEAAYIRAGSISFAGNDLRALDDASWRRLRGHDLAMVFQDPMSSLNPLHRVGAQVAEAIAAHGAPAGEARGRAVALLRQVGIPDAERRAKAFPHELSGGMRQRVMIATAIANHPRLMVADEPTASLDVTIQAQVLDLLASLKRDGDMALIFISHSLPVVAEIADRVVVMYAGEVVEEGPVSSVFAAPAHPYTAALLASAPGEDGAPPRAIGGIVPSPDAVIPGCRFAPRCTHYIERCETEPSVMTEVAPGRYSRCVRWAEL
jgi:peptide/nickel transport system permease protein